MGRFRFRSLILLFTLTFAFLGCERPFQKGSSLTIQVPRSLNKVGPLATLPSNRKACFGVNVTGPGIVSQTPNSCSPTTGTLAGYVEAGQSMIVTVAKGTERKVELYIYLQPEGQSQSCHELTSSFSTSQITNTYLVASQEHVDTTTDTTVDLTVNFPGLTQHLVQQLQLPSSCAGTTADSSSNPYHFQFTASEGTATDGTNYKLKGRVGALQEDKILSGTGYNLYVRD